ncbi:MAG: phenylacetate--CoA ligase family protein [Vicinamibacterales bacterium]
MHDRLLRAYHRLPSGPRSLVASAWGLYLRSWRYGPETDRLVDEALERERWSADRWEGFRSERIARILHVAATEVPFYRSHWAERRRRGDRSSWDLLENWPVLEKESVRQQSHAFVRDGCRINRMYREHTSGTSGTPVVLYWSRETVRAWYALAEARWRRWYGVSRHDRWAILGGQIVAPAAQRHPPFWVWNAGLSQLYLSSYHLASDLVAHYLDALASHRVTYLLGYSSAMHALAEGALRLGRRDVRLQVAIANAEPLYTHQRQAIGEAFGCPVRETYGMAEIVTAAGECEHGTLHSWPEVGHLEILAPESAVEGAAAGDFVATGLLNSDMLLVRYRIGDRGARATARACGCGRTLPALAYIEGRTDDVIFTKEGRAVGRLDPVFKSDLPIREAQIVQERLDRMRIRYVPAPEFNERTGRALAERLRERVGDVQVVLEAVDHIPRTSSGKFRAVVSMVPPAERPPVER